MWAMKSNLHRHRRSCGGNTEKAVEESSWVGGLLNTQVERKAVQGLLRLVEAERRGEPIEGVLLSRLLRALGSLGMYATSFEVPFLEETAAFYATEGCAVMASADVAEYLIHCEVNAFLLPGRLSPRTKPWLCLFGRRIKLLFFRHAGSLIETWIPWTCRVISNAEDVPSQTAAIRRGVYTLYTILGPVNTQAASCPGGAPAAGGSYACHPRTARLSMF